MKEDFEDQQELFAEFKKPKRGIERLRQKYMPHKRFFITLSIENLILISIGIIMLIVLFFSLGVERGKRISINTGEVGVKVVPEAIVKESAAIKKVASKDSAKAKYTIQIVAYRQESAANRKIKALEKQGFSSFIIPGENLFQVCIGKYKTLEEAKEAQLKLKNQYSDCFVKGISDN